MNNPFVAPGGSSGSFLPEDYIARKAEARANVITLVLFAIVMAGVVGVFVLTNSAWQRIRAREVDVTKQYEAETAKMEQIKTLEAQRAQMMEKAEITAALFEKVPRWAVLGEIVLRMPRDMGLDNFNMKSKRIDPPPPPPPSSAPIPLVKSLTGAAPTAKADEKPKVQAPQFEYALTIAGWAVHNNDIADFLEGLRNSPILEHVELQFIREAKEKDKELRKFEIDATLKSSVDPEVLAGSLRKLVQRNKPDDGVRVVDERRNAAAGKGE